MKGAAARMSRKAGILAAFAAAFPTKRMARIRAGSPEWRIQPFAKSLSDSLRPALRCPGEWAGNDPFQTQRPSILNPAMNRNRSLGLQQRAERYFPGGVNSPVRAFRAVGGAPPFIERAEGAYLLRRRRQPLHRLLRLLGPDDSGPRLSAGGGGHRARGAQLGQLWRLHGRRGRSGRAHRGLLSRHREDALRQLRHRGHDVGHPPGARRHRPQNHRQVRRLLSRPLPTGCWSRPAPAWRHSAFPARRAFPKRSRT